MSKLVVLSGIPGSGKSFFSKLLRKAKGGHVYVVSSDELRTLACGSPQIFEKEKEIWTMFYELPKVYSVDKDSIVILDATQIVKKFRTDAVRDLKSYFDSVELVVFTIPKEIVNFQNLQREWAVPQDVLDKFYRDFTMPDDEELAFFNHTYYIESTNDFAKVIDKL
ncbi:MAG: AAA family ATPase [Bacilli bacterium]